MNDLINAGALAAFGMDGATAPRFDEERRRPDAPPARQLAEESREAERPLRGRLTNPSNVRRYVLGGKGTITIVSKRTSQRFTFKLGRPRNASSDDARIYVRVLTGPENTADYEWLGTWHTRLTRWRGVAYAAGYRHGRDARISVNAPSTRTAVWFLTRVQQGAAALDAALAQCEVWHEGRCGLCGRKLTVPESIANGIGPVCAGRET